MNTIGEMILIHRRRLNASQSDVAKRAGVSRNTLSALENGDMNIKLLTLIKVVSAMGLNIRIQFHPKDEEGGDK